MATYKILGQANITSTGTTGTSVMPAQTGAAGVVVSSIVIANTTTSLMTYRICVGTSITTLSAEKAIAWDVPVDPNSTVSLNLGLTFTSTDTIYASASVNTGLTISVFGSVL